MGKLESKNIEKYFQHDGKPLKTLDGIDLNVEDGEFVCIVGPSGCGKSTFLRITAGLEKPDGGEVLLDEAWFRHGIGGGFGDNQAYNFSIKDATFSRIRELSLAYMYNGAALDNVGLSSITFTGTARNLFAWYKELVGVDPGVNVGGIQTGFGLDYFANPSTKSFLFSLTANF